MSTEINLIGVYSVGGQTDVHLIEIEIKAKHTDIDISEFTQSQDGVDRLDWQTPWDEKYLNDQGTEIIGDWLDLPKVLTDTTRLIFFFHLIDFNKPLLTPFGAIDLKRPASMPYRLTTLSKYEQPN